MLATCIAGRLLVLLLAQERSSLDGTWEIAAETTIGERPDFGKPGAKTATVPAPFEEALGLQFDGVAWYRRALPREALPKSAGEARVRVEFAAAATEATVFCNGREVGRHLGGCSPFRVDVTDALKLDGSDELEVRLDEKVGHNTQGFLPVIQPHFGGLWQGVTLCVDRGPTIDREALFTFGRFDPRSRGGELIVRGQWLAGPAADPVKTPARIDVEIDVDTDITEVWTEPIDPAAGNRVALSLREPSVEPWAPGASRLYRVVVRLLRADGRVLDEVERRVGFRSLAADGTQVLWNGEPLQVRGLLHWGYSPPHLAPPSDRAWWKSQLEELGSLGFNTLKCCLWVPPPVVYELCDELGLLVWQEYPTWHPTMDEAHRGELRREYEEFFAHDGPHPSVAFRSLTCETGHDAELAVIQELYDACHAAIPDTLVVDDSSWIGWQRVTDFWDEHPYGNHRWFPGRLAEFARHQEEKGRKPLLLGECMAGGTWIDLAAWRAAHGDEADGAKWWRPACLDAQVEFEAWLASECGAETVASLGPTSRATALEARKFQIETLRATLPDAGYVVSVARDFATARMGLRDDLDRLKWPVEAWRWHGDVMVSLSTDGCRAFRELTGLELQVSAFGEVLDRKESSEFSFQVEWLDEDGARLDRSTIPVLRWNPKSKYVTAFDPGETTRPRAATLHVSILERPRPAPGKPPARDAATTCVTENSWRLWRLPPIDEDLPESVRVADHLDAATLDFLENGGRVLLRVAGSKGTFKSQDLWWLRGAPFTPPHPLNAVLPPDFLRELQPFDLDGGRVMPWTTLRGQVDPILAFWETHDLAEVRAHLFAFDTRVGKGRLLATTLDDASEAGRYVRACFARHLADGPAPRRAFSAATIAALRSRLAVRRLDLPQWRFRVDPDDRGLAAGFEKSSTDVAGWRTIEAGAHWEGQGEDQGVLLEHYTGVAWYRVDVDVPAEWAGADARAVFEGIDDSAIAWLDGVEVGRFGDPATKTTVWTERSVAELGRRLVPGRHVVVLRVVDHQGSGGMWKPAFLTTGPADATGDLLE